MKNLESFKSENIQSIYDFLEQDADVTNFKRDLIAVADYKKTDLHDLGAEVFQYADLMKEDLTDKIVFVFREDGYLGMFGLGNFTKFEHVERTIREYTKLKIGDRVRVNIYGERVYGVIYLDNVRMYIIQNEHDGTTPDELGWEKYGFYSWEITSYDYINLDHSRLEKIIPIIPNLIIDEGEIKNLKETMHFTLVI